jgi:8-oxo-dGTP pyrophosphatase MutT (NUDIX family)
VSVRWTVADIERAVSRPASRIDAGEGTRRAAVAAILTPDLEVILLRRAVHPSDPWSGHVSFPGGRVEPGETPLEAAVRETREEIGVDLSVARWLGPLDEVQTAGHLPALIIHPFVFALPTAQDLRPNYEVASIHRVALSVLIEGEGRGDMDHLWRGQMLRLPRVDFDGGRLWGLTLHMVDDLLHRLDGRGRGLERVDGPGGGGPW